MFHQVEQARRMLMTRRVLRVWLVTGAVVARTRIVSSGQLLPRTRFWNVRCWRSGSPDRFPNALLGVLASDPPRHPCCVDPLRAWSLASPAGTTGCRVDIAFSRAPPAARGGSSRVSRGPRTVLLTRTTANKAPLVEGYLSPSGLLPDPP